MYDPKRKNYPAEAVIRYHSNGLKFLRFLTASHGTKDITEKLSIGAKELRLKTNPRKIEQNGKKYLFLLMTEKKNLIG